MTVSVRPEAASPVESSETTPRRTTAGRRASLNTADFRAAVLDHVVHTCAKEIRDASALDFYQRVRAHGARSPGPPLAGDAADAHRART